MKDLESSRANATPVRLFKSGVRVGKIKLDYAVNIMVGIVCDAIPCDVHWDIICVRNVNNIMCEGDDTVTPFSVEIVETMECAIQELVWVWRMG